MKETLNSFIIRKRIEKAAAQLLHHKEKTITEVSEDLGFNDLSSFSKAFKKFYGISPNQFKKKVLKNLARFAKLKARMDKLKLPLNNIFVI